GSGGLTPMTQAQVTAQLSGWVAAGIPRVKMKIGREWGADPEGDLERVEAARAAVGDAELFVDANGGYSAKQALRVAESLHRLGVTWFEEPVSSDRLDELRAIRKATPLDIAAGEYGYTPWYFDTMLKAEAVDVLQADITRCLGVTGFLQASTLAAAAGIPFSAHCAPALHAQVGCAAPDIAHIEYFHDHVRLEGMLLSGVPEQRGGVLAPDPGVRGLGLALRPEAEQYRVAHHTV
ncbi:MAG: mandelate racemase, partial [Candidatus Dormibacteraeota bacterium]|nr:mandelate racemase [Candidatus Dormibacteraeota bacterium]